MDICKVVVVTENREIYNNANMLVKCKKRVQKMQVHTRSTVVQTYSWAYSYTSWENATKIYSNTTKNENEVLYKTNEAKQQINT